MKLLRRVGHWLRRRRDDAALAEEIESHRALIQADLEAHGMPPAEARAASRRAMGNVALAREDARDVWIAMWADRLWRDAKYGLRGLRREPAFAMTAVLTLALGVVTTTTVFSVADAELWKPLPYPHPEQLVAVFSRGPGVHANIDSTSGADLLDWRAGAPAFASLAGVGRTARAVLQRDHAESVYTMEITADYFATLGRRPIAGRLFGPEDARRSQAAVLTDRAWQRVLGADPAVVGRALVLDARSVVIIGIVRADDSLGPDVDLYLPLNETAAAFLDRSAATTYGAIGRLRPGVDAAVARAQLQSAADRVASAFPLGRTGHAMCVEDLRSHVTGYNWRPLYFFLAASLVVLLLSAVNVAALLLARALRRTREFALRGALGAGSRAIAGQLLMEGALIAAPAGAMGVLVSAWAVHAFSSALPADFLERGTSIPIDLRVCAFAVAVTAATTMIFVLVPLLLARRIDLSGALGPGGRSGRSAGEGRARVALLTAQVALTMVLLSGAGIFLRSFVELTRVPLGFDPSGLWAVRASLSGPHYATDAQVRAYAEDLLRRARVVPGVRDAAIDTSSPLGSGPLLFIAAAGQPRPAAAEDTGAILRAASPGCFQTLGVRIVRGRDFSAADVAGAPRAAIINEYLARQMFGGQEPIGQRIELLPGIRAPWANHPGAVLVVGVVSNVKEVGLNEIDFADVYVPFAQMPAPSIELVLRADASAAGLGTALRRAAADVDPTVPVTSITTLDDRLAGALQGDRFNLLLICSFAGVAILLAGIGVYGAIAYAVQARTREFGVRLALGARPASLVSGALRQALRLGAVGGTIGLAATFAMARVIGSALYLAPRAHSGLLYGVTTTDPVALTCAFVGILGVALVAGAVPARRVGRIDPALALRTE